MYVSTFNKWYVKYKYKVQKYKKSAQVHPAFSCAFLEILNYMGVLYPFYRDIVTNTHTVTLKHTQCCRKYLKSSGKHYCHHDRSSTSPTYNSTQEFWTVMLSQQALEHHHHHRYHRCHLCHRHHYHVVTIILVIIITIMSTRQLRLIWRILPCNAFSAGDTRWHISLSHRNNLNKGIKRN